ncbi:MULTISPECIES: LpxL/LpxP family Kdo(2)-lipid IV(A) lauroyl/palmitoleoyl acyltransferase [Ferrimonas]|uniref:LpxL/LpxP family Kdo(2)-lipid IV(A) lauroyl/palmitoleoyl acyltransferase n=1 Tax=Ferrimonas TaxID=44011 RepID=UPI000413C83C|nr:MULTISPECIES: LpxL/LpxP family Kdo(2)-lipid IV(A) lauroyl/palmitoleoyl acyltransferase [Ferrimonas]USD37018.1 LpxL/LpxP family Kdo(2)-lipid IV(A) lauroyl/palmitoleoyl acyltransferase [Ferrimonas sp. SCSIO 43195]
MVTDAQFDRAFLHPRFWPMWLGIAVLKVLVLLPLPIQWRLGKALGGVLKRLLKKRAHVARVNLKLCFPDKSDAEREALLDANFAETGMALLDCVNGWWWSDARIQSHMTLKGMEHIDQAKADGQGVILFAAHCLMLEPGARLFGQHCPGVGVYRPHNNKFMEYLQVKGRLRSNKGLIPKKEVRQMVKALRAGEVIWYTADQDAGRKGAVFAPFFAVDQAVTVTGASTLAKLGKAKVMPFFVERNADHSGYTIEVLPPLENFPGDSDQADAERGNKILESLISRRPEQYMWLHRRFKTRPNPDDPKFY